MKATKSILNIQSILKDFSGLAEARKSYTLRTRLVFIFCGVTIAMVLFFAHSVVNPIPMNTNTSSRQMMSPPKSAGWKAS